MKPEFDPTKLVQYLEDKGWVASYSLDHRHYWNLVWEGSAQTYVIEIPVWPGTKITFLKHQLRGYAVDRGNGDKMELPNFEWNSALDRYMTYYNLRIWISALMEQ